MTNDIDAAFDGAEVVYAKSWGSKKFYGAPDKDIAERAQYRGKWIVDEAKMARTNERDLHALFAGAAECDRD